MIKKKLLTLSLALMLTSCSNYGTKPTTNSPSIMCPTGGPAVALSCMASSKKFETTSDPSLLMGYFGAENYDVIVAPTDIGIKAIKQGANYQLAATITFGNFYLVSTGLDDNSTIDENDSIVLFQKNGLPDKIFHYIYGLDFETSITYVSNVAVAATSYQNKKVTTESGDKIDADYVLLSEPKLTALQIDEEKVINLNEKFEEKSGIARIFQASVFTKNSFEGADAFLENLKNGIENMTQITQTAVKDYMNVVSDPQTFFGMTPELAQKCINKNNSLGIGFMYAKDAIPAIKNYLEIIGVGEINENYIKQ